MRLRVLSTAALLACCAGAYAQNVNFQGFTNGCFDGGPCAPPTTNAPQTITDLGLTYRNSTINATSAAGFLAIGSAPDGNMNNLGSFQLTGEPFDYNGQTFSLRVSFTAPPGTSPDNAIVDAVLIGQVESVDVGGVFVNFDNGSRHFDYDSGSFEFSVNDVSVTPGREVAVTGQLVVTAVPEPETYALMLAGLGVVGWMGKRRGRVSA